MISKHGQEAYDLQKRTLENSIPKTIPLENITLSPIDSFSASFAFKNLETQENYVDSILGKSNHGIEGLTDTIFRSHL